MRLLNVAGRIATSSTVPISRPAATACSFLVRSLPDTLRNENQLIVAEDDCVTAHGRFSGSGRPAAWIAADIVRIENGKLAAELTKAIRFIFSCCARAASDHVAAVPPKSVMKSRRRMYPPEGKPH
jgi:hypothetical protein